MNRHTAIVIAASVVMAAPFTVSALNIIGAQQVEYRWDSPSDFSFFAMSNHGWIEFCNTMPFWVTFDEFSIDTFYFNVAGPAGSLEGGQLDRFAVGALNSDEHLGTYTVKSVLLDPASSDLLYGKFRSDRFTAVQHILMNFDFEFDSGGGGPGSGNFVAVVGIDTPILGVVPYTATKAVTAFELDQIMSADSLSCAQSPASDP